MCVVKRCCWKASSDGHKEQINMSHITSQWKENSAGYVFIGAGGGDTENEEVRITSSKSSKVFCESLVFVMMPIFGRVPMWITYH